MIEAERRMRYLKWVWLRVDERKKKMKEYHVEGTGGGAHNDACSRSVPSFKP